MVVAFLTAVSVAARDEPALIAAWQRLAALDHAGALVSFEELHRNARVPGEAALGLAHALLNANPRTPQKVARADTLLALIVAEPAASRAVRAQALYSRARLHHQQLAFPDLTAAERLYAEAWQTFPEEPPGQLALGKFLSLRLRGATSEERAALLEENARVADQRCSPAGRRLFHLHAGLLVLYLGLPPATARRHLATAVELGLDMREVRVDIRAAVAWLAWQLEEKDSAEPGMRAFMADYPSDPRTDFFANLLGGSARPPPP